MKNVCINTNVYLITVDDLQNGMTCHVCATKSAACNLFEKIVRENYFNPEDKEEDLVEATVLGFWESKNGDVVKYSECAATIEEEI